MNGVESAAAPRRRFVLLALAVVALGAALRAWRLGEWSYWTDEAHTISDANALVSGDAGQGFAGHRLSFFLYGAAYSAARALGIPFGETVARAVPAFFGVLAVAMTAGVGALVAGRSGAILGALLVALSPFQIYWSQNARSYALEVALAIPAGIMLARGLATQRWGPLLTGVALLGLAASAHPTALALVPGIVAYALVATRFSAANGSRKRLLWIAGAIVALGAAFVASPLGKSVSLHFLVKSDRSPFLFLATVAFYFRPPMLAAGACLAIRAFARRDAPSALLALLSLGTIAAGFAASWLVRANAQYVIVAFPFLALLVGREIADLVGGRDRALKLGGFALAATLAVDQAAGAFLYFGPEHGHRAYFREASAYVWGHAAPGDLVATTQAPIVECYLNPSNPRPREATASLYLGPYEPEQLELMLSRRRRTWFIVLDVDLEEFSADYRQALARFLREECRQVAAWPLQFSGRDQSLHVWRYDPP